MQRTWQQRGITLKISMKRRIIRTVLQALVGVAICVTLNTVIDDPRLFNGKEVVGLFFVILLITFTIGKNVKKGW